jgi:hypothetical protein
VLEHRLPLPVNLVFHLVLVAIAVAGILFSSKKVQLALALLGTAGFLAYIALLFMRL